MTKKMLHSIVVAGSLFFAMPASAQLYINSGAQLTIESGASVTVQGDITSNADVLGAGKVILKGSSNQNVNMNNFTIPNLEIDNVSNATLTGSLKIGTNLTFTNGSILLGTNNLTMGAASTITNPSNSRFVVTNGTGKLVKTSQGAAAYSYPVGYSTLTYNPVTISNSGTVDDIAVRALANVFDAGLTGTAYTKEVVDASWDISEAVAGGSNLSVTASWYATDELAGFNRNKSGLSYYIPSPALNLGWDMLNSQTGVASGSGPYSYTRTNVTQLGAFAVGNRPVLSPLLVSPKVFLQGAFSGTNMTDNLRTLNYIPTTEPYTGMSGFTHSGSGGAETSVASIVGSGAAAGNNAIVDWVFVQLHDGTTGAVLSTRAALLQRDGDVVDTDGTSPLNMAGNAAGSYYVSIRHRNHLGVRSTNNMALAKTTTTVYDFTTALNKAYAVGVTNNAMASLAGGVFGMWGGNANSNATVRYSGPSNDESTLLNTCLAGNKGTVLNGYYNCDLNLNGVLRYSGPNNDENYLLNTILSGVKGTVITQPTF